MLASRSLASDTPHVSAAHSIEGELAFIEVAIEELAPHYMLGYGPASQQEAAEMYGIMANLQSVSMELHRYVRHLPQGKEHSARDCG